MSTTTSEAPAMNGSAAPEADVRSPLEQLRKPFPPETIGKLPKVTCRDCSNRNATCQNHQKRDCAVCGNWISTSHIHLDYVGHAEVTDRLLTVDPEWNWEPAAHDVDPQVLAAAVATGNPEIVQQVIESSPPKFVRDQQGRPIGLWIKLTVDGMTRRGFGSVTEGSFEAEKQLIGDALRNAAMRFGVALDLWSKSELESAVTDEASPEPPAQAPATQPPPAQRTPVDEETDKLAKELAERVRTTSPIGEQEKLKSHLRGQFGDPMHMDPAKLPEAIAIAKAWPPPPSVPSPVDESTEEATRGDAPDPGQVDGAAPEMFQGEQTW